MLASTPIKDYCYDDCYCHQNSTISPTIPVKFAAVYRVKRSGPSSINGTMLPESGVKSESDRGLKKDSWETAPYKTNPRPPYLAASDYVFYVKRQARDRNIPTNPVKSATISNANSSPTPSTASKGSKKSTLEKQKNPPLPPIRASPEPPETTMEELTNFTDLIRRLKDDLRSSYCSFVEEFVSDPNDGVTLLLDLLKTYRKNGAESIPRHPTLPHSNRDRQQQMKRNLAEELDCIQCIYYTLRCQKSLLKIATHSSGLTTVASTIMSSCTKSRKVALELLSRTCEDHPEGYGKVMEAMSALRLIYGEPVRFKFLVSMLLNRSKAAPGFEYAAMHLFNVLLAHCGSSADRVRLQGELEEAGLDTEALEKNLREKNISPSDPVWEEIRHWNTAYLSIDSAIDDKRKMGSENNRLRTEVELLRRALKKLEDDKASLLKVERELKEKCNDLTTEVTNLKKIINDPKPSSLKSSESEDSDHSDTHATDSGRSSYLNEVEFPPVVRRVQAHPDVIEEPALSVHDIPTLRPPDGFQSDVDETPNVLSEDRSMGSLKIIHTTETPSPSNSLIVTVKKDEIEWNYPALPEPKVCKVASRANSSLGGSEIAHDQKPRIIGVHHRRPSDPDSGSLSRSGRGRSDGLRPHLESTHEIVSNGILSNPADLGIPSGFILKPRPLSGASTPSLNNDSLHRTSYAKISNTLNMNTGYASCPVAESPIVPSPCKDRPFPLPVAYKKNPFLLRGHGNCGLYSSTEDQLGSDQRSASSASDEAQHCSPPVGGWL